MFKLKNYTSDELHLKAWDSRAQGWAKALGDEINNPIPEKEKNLINAGYICFLDVDINNDDWLLALGSEQVKEVIEIINCQSMPAQIKIKVDKDHANYSYRIAIAINVRNESDLAILRLHGITPFVYG